MRLSAPYTIERAGTAADAAAVERWMCGDTPEPAIRRMTDVIVERFAPISAILFGSRARGGADGHGDADPLVVMPDGTDEKGACVAIQVALQHSPLPKDILVNTQEHMERRGRMPGSVQRAALRGGARLYG